MTISKAQKTLILVGTILALGANLGVYFYIPKRVDKLEDRVERDHDTLIGMKHTLEQIKTRVDLIGLGDNNEYIERFNVLKKSHPNISDMQRHSLAVNPYIVPSWADPKWPEGYIVISNKNPFQAN